MTISSSTLSTRRMLCLSALMLSSLVLAAGAADAQVAREYDPDGADVARDADALADELAPDAERRINADTLLTFTNTSRRPNLIGCTARNGNGHVVGATRTALPPQGVRYVRVSDMTAQRPFAGSVVCKALEPARAVALLVGPGLSDLPVGQSRHNDLVLFRVPLAVTY